MATRGTPQHLGNGGAPQAAEARAPQAAARTKAPDLAKLTVDPVALRHEVFVVTKQIDALVRLAALADERGLELWLLGGLAGNVTHYGRFALCHRAGARELRAEMFTKPLLQHVMNAQTQDFDLVVARKDGATESIAEIQEFESAAAALLPGFIVEAHGLNTPLKATHPPLRSERFLNQHHNTIDLLMVHLNAAGPATAVRDLRAWDDPVPAALRDCADGLVRLSLSAAHTLHTPEGGEFSPPIKHVVRALIKVSRYAARIDAASMRTMRDQVAAFDPLRLNNVVVEWFRNNAPKLRGDAIQLERTWALLDELGLRAKLRKMPVPEFDAFFGVEPLPSVRTGRGTGLFARDIPLGPLKHVTHSYDVYNAIASGPFVHPSLLMSVAKDHAVFGKGAYSAGAADEWIGAPYTVGLIAAPDAEEGIDFHLSWVNKAGVPLTAPYVIWHNNARVFLAPQERASRAGDMIAALFDLEQCSTRKRATRDLYVTELAARTLSDDDVQIYRALAYEHIDAMTAGNAIEVAEAVAALPRQFLADPGLAHRFVQRVPEEACNAISYLAHLVGAVPPIVEMMKQGVDRLPAAYGNNLAMNFFSADVDVGFIPVLDHVIAVDGEALAAVLVRHAFHAANIAKLVPQASAIVRHLSNADDVQTLQRAVRDAQAEQPTPELAALEQALEARGAALAATPQQRRRR